MYDNWIVWVLIQKSQDFTQISQTQQELISDFPHLASKAGRISLEILWSFYVSVLSSCEYCNKLSALEKLGA